MESNLREMRTIPGGCVGLTSEIGLEAEREVRNCSWGTVVCQCFGRKVYYADKVVVLCYGSSLLSDGATFDIGNKRLRLLTRNTLYSGAAISEGCGSSRIA